jgi:thymidylate synthase ThyX
MTEPSAKIICDSISSTGQRLTTMEVKMHRFVLAEFNTHRVFSRNSASSRAIPVHKQIHRVLNDPAYPISWPTEKPGMQGGEELMPSEQRDMHKIWMRARDEAVAAVERMTIEVSPLNRPLHKSVANRLLEPFMWHTVIVTSTKWDNFWTLRCSPQAQPEIRAAAEAMLEAYKASVPDRVEQGEWHLPYVTGHDMQDLLAGEQGPPPSLVKEKLCKISAARCCRVSYLTHEGQRDYHEDLKLFDRLVSASPMHASPLEHVATPCPSMDWSNVVDVRSTSPHHLGNFTGWDQLRHMVEDEVHHG